MWAWIAHVALKRTFCFGEDQNLLFFYRLIRFLRAPSSHATPSLLFLGRFLLLTELHQNLSLSIVLSCPCYLRTISGTTKSSPLRYLKRLQSDHLCQVRLAFLKNLYFLKHRQCVEEHQTVLRRIGIDCLVLYLPKHPLLDRGDRQVR